MTPNIASPIPSWLPDETFFSLCSRYHVLSGHTYAWQTAVELFGHRTGGTHHDFPNRLDVFARRTGETIGSVEQIARDRTLLSFYAPFLPESDVALAIDILRGPSVAHLKFRLGLLTSRFRAHHPLKACPECMRADVRRFGWAYWHLHQQFPGVWTCTKHACPLAVSTRKSTGVGRFQWCLPTAADLILDWTHSNSQVTDDLLRLARIAMQVVDQPRQQHSIDMHWMLAPLRARLFDLGWITSAGHLRLKAAATDYLRFTEPLRCVPEFVSLPRTPDQAAVQLGRLLRPPHGHAHPLRMLLAIAWLFKDYAEFEDARQLAVATARTHQRVSASRAASLSAPSPDPRRALLLCLLAQGHSVSSAADAADINVGTAIAWAAQAGVPTPQRPKMFKPDLRARLVAQLRRGMDKAQLAGSEGVSMQVITRLLRSEVGLHAAWHSARLAVAQGRARASWLKLISARGAIGIKLMRAEDPATFAWLYRNDRVWLQAHSPPKLGFSSRRSSVQWDERDVELSGLIQRAATLIADGGSDKPLRLWQLYQAVPELKVKLPKLDRLPLTRMVIDQAIRHGKAAARQAPPR